MTVVNENGDMKLLPRTSNSFPPYSLSGNPFEHNDSLLVQEILDGKLLKLSEKYPSLIEKQKLVGQ